MMKGRLTYMTERISREGLMMATAKLWSLRSTCRRLQVGAVIALNDRPISSGYNGAPSGMEHCNKENCSSLQKCDRTIHAEMNAILFAARHGIPTEGTTLYTTHQPCIDCAKAIINAGIKTVYYEFPYRLTNGLRLLEDAGIEIILYES
jgi:dCMP deaminase